MENGKVVEKSNQSTDNDLDVKKRGTPSKAGDIRDSTCRAFPSRHHNQEAQQEEPQLQQPRPRPFTLNNLNSELKSLLSTGSHKYEGENWTDENED